MKKILVVAAIGLSITGFAQTASNKIQFTKGQKLEHLTQVDNVTNIEMMGQTMETKVSATVTRYFDVEDVKNGNATIEHKVKRMQMLIESPMGSQTFDSENEEDMKGEGGKAAEKSLKNKYSYVLDETGKVISIKLDDDNPNKDTVMDNPMADLGVGSELPKVGEKSEFAILPPGGVKKGGSWTDSTKMGKTVYTLTDLTASDYLVDFTQEGKIERKQDNNGMELIITLNNKTKGKMIVDRKSGLLKESTSTTDSEGNMEIMGQSAPMSSRITTKVTVKGI